MLLQNINTWKFWIRKKKTLFNLNGRQADFDKILFVC